jgi:hypothetical protein
MLQNTAGKVYKRRHSSSGRQINHFYASYRVYRDILEVNNASVYVTVYSNCSHIADSAAPQQPRRRLAEPLVQLDTLYSRVSIPPPVYTSHLNCRPPGRI